MGATTDDRPWGECFVDSNGRPATIELEQLDKKTFRLGTAFQHDQEGRTYHIAAGEKTDLASVPGPFRWFVSSYGRHTPAALLHDQLVKSGTDLEPPVSREAADTVFRNALKCLGVPLIRRTLMWAAVALGTRWEARGLKRILVVIWALASLIGTGVAIYALATGEWGLAAGAAVAPLPFALLWGKQVWAGIVAGYSAVWVMPPTVLAVLGYALYWVLERIVLFVRPATRGTDARPTPYTEF